MLVSVQRFESELEEELDYALEFGEHVERRAENEAHRMKRIKPANVQRLVFFRNVEGVKGTLQWQNSEGWVLVRWGGNRIR